MEACRYVCDSRHSLTTAPFEAQDTHFSVFEQTPRTATTAAPNAPFEAHHNASHSAGLASFPEHDLSLSPAVRPLELDLGLAGMLDDQAESKPPPLANLYPTTSASLRGALFKTRFYGQSHWMNFAHQSFEVLAVMQAHEADESNHATFARCKAVGRTIKTQESRAAQLPGSLRDMVPTRAVPDRLVQAYLRTFQTVFGILHGPSFRADYKAFWGDSGSVSEAFGITLLLVMCIGSTFCLHETGISRATALQWIYVASAWLSSPKEKARLNLDGLRIQCLFLLARQAKSVHCDIAWLSTGSLLRMAMHMGVHIDPENLAQILWTTVLELEVQSSMECGGLPLIDSDDYDCALPSNIDDASLEAGRPAGNAKPMEQFTQPSIQILLMKTMPVRLKIARFINSFRSEHSFEKDLSLSAELSAALKSCSVLIEAYCMSSTPPTAFQTKLFDLLVQRFLLALHHPFAVKAISNPLCYYSRKVCLETTLSLFSHAVQSGDDDFHRLRLCGTGLFRDVYTQSALYICGELTDQVEADRPFPTNPCSTFDRKEMRKAIEKYLELATARIYAGEKNIRCKRPCLLIAGTGRCNAGGCSGEAEDLCGVKEEPGGVLFASEVTDTRRAGNTR
ncbi:hypothetical protein VTN00DRAFT_3043 [Thermoascus crustaceus]|uniref:uncharacterized protein n=1 Tax=Thermoascus crustaceus TaxID=5088 RepID=UPI0037423F53